LFRRNRRIAWLLNHRTLMPYEADLIHRLGFEVFTPKVIPESRFRSAMVTHEFDRTLSIPTKALKALNRQNFYEDAWRPDVVTALNRYFGSVFVIPHGIGVGQALDNFEGNILLRAFGLSEAGGTYADLLSYLHSSTLLRRIDAIHDRFFFAEGYDNLHDPEPPELAGTAMHLPLGAPRYIVEQTPGWKHTDRRILFSCPSIAADPHQRQVYDDFRVVFGDMPHAIVGAQETPIDDPNVLGFVTDDQLSHLYRSCSALYYHSREPRHVHYTPLEAAAAGMPIVFHRGSLVDRLSGGNALGGVHTSDEARALLVRLVEGDDEFAAELVASQTALLDSFRDQYCREEWRRQLTRAGIVSDSRPGVVRTVWTEARRLGLRPLAHGRATLRLAAVAPPAAPVLPVGETSLPPTGSLADGLDFADRRWPDYVQFVDGVGPAEPGGRWVHEPAVTIALTHSVAGPFRLALKPLSYPDVHEVPITIRVGDSTESTTIGGGDAQLVRFDVAKPANVIEIQDRSARGERYAHRFGLARMQLIEDSPFPNDDGAVGHVLAEMDFSQPEVPACVAAMRGLSGWEGWGRWSDRGTVVFDLTHIITGRLSVAVRGVAHGRNVGQPIEVEIGDERRSIVLGDSFPAPEAVVDFDVHTTADSVKLHIPYPSRTDTDQRLLGIGLTSVRITRSGPKTVSPHPYGSDQRSV
jgi:hypothetical protein